MLKKMSESLVLEALRLPTASELQLPVQEYSLGDFHHFGKTIPGRLGWSIHLGDDVAVSAGVEVAAIGDGKVVWARQHAGTARRRSWGGLVVIAHRGFDRTFVFYSVYGHLGGLRVHEGEQVARGEVLGHVGMGESPESGYWKLPHLHFAIYTGPWRGQVVPGYWRWHHFWRTRVWWWKDPRQFIATYGARVHKPLPGPGL